MGLHTGCPATNGTVTVADPAPMALSLAVKLMPEDLLDESTNARPLEMVGGPGQVPPVPSNPPERSSVEPTVTHTAVSYSEGCHGAFTDPLEHGVLVGVVVISAAGVVVTEGPCGSVKVADEHPATTRPAATVRTRRLIDTTTTYRCLGLSGCP